MKRNVVGKHLRVEDQTIYVATFGLRMEVVADPIAKYSKENLTELPNQSLVPTIAAG